MPAEERAEWAHLVRSAPSRPALPARRSGQRAAAELAAQTGGEGALPRRCVRARLLRQHMLPRGPQPDGARLVFTAARHERRVA